MRKNKRKSDVKSAVEEKIENAKKSGAKRLRTSVATLTICAAAVGAYYSPHFRAASSDWLNRWREGGAEETNAEKKERASGDETLETLAQAPSFRDFLTDEYGEEGARELLGLDDSAAPFSTPEPGPGFADYVAAESRFPEAVEPQEIAQDFGPGDAASFPTAPEPAATFADYVAAETETSELVEPQVIAQNSVSDDATSFPTAPEPGLTFADYVAAEEMNDDLESEAETVSVERTRLASAVEPIATDDETALATRLQEEMKERGVGNPRIERWGGRFWRASGFATTNEGVATFCEAVDVDPISAQRAALAKFEAATF